MNADHDDLNEFFRPLRSRRLIAGDHCNRLENSLMSEITKNKPLPRRGLWFGASIFLLAGLAAAAGEWWEAYSVEETDNGDGTYNLTVTNQAGEVEFDETLENGTAVLHTEDGTYIVVEPCEADPNEIDAALEDLKSTAAKSDG
jgi:hypothetical protein